MFRLLPREFGFFDHFEKQMDQTVAAARIFEELLDDLENAGPKAKRIKEHEHEADVIAHMTVEMLHKTFITPIDRESIHRLVTRMDDVLDAIDAASEHITLYEIKAPTNDARSLARILRQAVEQTRAAVGRIKNLKKESKQIIEICVDINRIENEGDAVLRAALAKLFREEKDALFVMKWKEIYEDLEHATDRCEDVANIIESVVLENA